MRKLFKSESRVKTLCVFLAAFALYVFGVAQANTQTVNTSWIAVENHFDSAQFKSTCAAGTAGGATGIMQYKNSSGSFIGESISDIDYTPYGWVVFYNTSGSMTQYVKYDIPSWALVSPYAVNTNRVLCRGAIYDNALNRNVTATVRAEATR